MDITFKIASGIASAGAGFAANKALGAGWKGVTGREVPTEDNEDDFKLGEILVFAAVSAAVIAVVQVFAGRAVNKWLNKRTEQA